MWSCPYGEQNPAAGIVKCQMSGIFPDARHREARRFGTALRLAFLLSPLGPFPVRERS